MAAIVGDEPEWDVPLRLLGGLHFLVLAGDASWDDPVEQHAEFLRGFVREQSVQTNEVQRSWMLLPCFLRAAQLLDSRRAGRRRARTERRAEPRLGSATATRTRRVSGGRTDAALTLSGDERSHVPDALLHVVPRVSRRVGIDLAPIDVTTDEGARLLECFVWAGQDERLDRLQRAIDVVRGQPAGARARRLRARAAERAARSADARLRDGGVSLRPGRDPHGQCGRRSRSATAPVAFVTGREAARRRAGWGMRIARYPGGEREFVGHADFHGAWLDYDAVITSAHNPKLKLIRRLLESRRQRDKEGLFVCEGEDLVDAAARCRHRAGRAARRGRGRGACARLASCRRSAIRRA